MAHHLLADQYLVNKVKELLPINEQPVFALCMTNSTHISYDSWERQEKFKVLNPDLSARTREILEQYASAINQADQALENLVDYFQQQSGKTIIIVFGDHLPGISSVFQDLGSFRGDQGFHRFHTPLAIWSNFDLPRAGRILSANLLPALVCDLLKIEPSRLPFQFQLAREMYREVDVFSTYIQDKQGQTYSRQNPPAALKKLAHEYDLLQYDLLEGQSFALRR